MVIRYGLIAALCLVLMLTGSLSWAATARLSASEVLEYETVDLVLRGSRSESPDVSVLLRDFEILNRSSQSSIQFVNGEIRVTENIVTLSLRPRRTGVIQVPSIAFGNERTQTLELTVKPIDAVVRREIDELAFFEVEVSDSRPYQGEAVFITRRLFYAPNVQLYGGLPGIPEVSDAIVQPLGEPIASSQVRGGRSYGVIESAYVLFADQSGPLTIPAVEVMTSMQIPSHSRGRPTGVPIASDELVLDILAPPDSYPLNKPWLAARDVSITSEFSSASAIVGDPLTFDVRVSADAALASQITPLDLVFPSSIKSYPESPRLEDQTQDGTLRGERSERYSLVPTQAGIFTLPEVRISWWDTQENRTRESFLASREIEILSDPSLVSGSGLGPDLLSEADSTTPPGVSDDLGSDEGRVFDWLDLVLLLGCLLLAGGWLRSSSQGQLWAQWMRREHSGKSPEESRFEKLMQAQSLGSTLLAFRAWLCHLPPEFNRQPEALLEHAEASLYAAEATSEGAPTASTLREAAKELRKEWLKARKGRALKRVLPGLYRQASFEES